MSSEQIIIKKLESAAIDQVSRFQMVETDDLPLKTFIRREAWKSAQASITQTYVAKVEGQASVIAYITLMCAEIKLEDGYAIVDKQGANRFEFQPAVRIARLACGHGHEGKGLDRKLGPVDKGDSQEGQYLIQGSFWGGYFDPGFDE